MQQATVYLSDDLSSDFCRDSLDDAESFLTNGEEVIRAA